MTLMCYLKKFVLEPNLPRLRFYIAYFIQILTLSAIFVLLICYVYMWYFIKKHNVKMIQSSNSSTIEDRRISHEHKLLKLGSCIVLGFSVCYIPMSIRYLLYLTGHDAHENYSWFYIFTLFNPILNTAFFFGYIKEQFFRYFKKFSQ